MSGSACVPGRFVTETTGTRDWSVVIRDRFAGLGKAVTDAGGHRRRMRLVAARAVVAAAFVGVSGASAQVAAPDMEIVQTSEAALAEDAGVYAARYDVPLDEAVRRLRAQEDSVAATEQVRRIYADRLAGIAIEHRPAYRIVVLLTGDVPVATKIVAAGGMAVPIVFRTGARATQAQVIAAIGAHRDEIRSMLPSARGMGADPRTGELVVMAKGLDTERTPVDAARARIAALTGVPVRIRVLDRPDLNMDVEGGGRVEGVDPANGRRYACTTGFVVTDGVRTGVATAAHCPDDVSYLDPGRGRVPLSFVGQWGVSYRDVQIHVAERPLQPLFHADTAKRVARPLTTWRHRASMRAGEMVCHRGETTGYSCAEVELTDYAPPDNLCGGPCAPMWVTVAGPSCAGGDSGGPVFSGSVAYGILKGGSYSRPGVCDFYYYMSTDYLPDGWSLLYRGAPATGSGLVAAGTPSSDRVPPLR